MFMSHALDVECLFGWAYYRRQVNVILIVITLQYCTLHSPTEEVLWRPGQGGQFEVQYKVFI